MFAIYCHLWNCLNIDVKNLSENGYMLKFFHRVTGPKVRKHSIPTKPIGIIGFLQNTLIENHSY